MKHSIVSGMFVMLGYKSTESSNRYLLQEMSRFDDFEAAWNAWPSGAEMSEFLVRLGFDFDRVTNICVDPVRGTRAEPELRRELYWRSPEAAYSVAIILADMMGEPRIRSNTFDQAVADSVRLEFQFQEVLTALMEKLHAHS